MNFRTEIQPLISRVNAYGVISRAVADGAARGLRRAYKHSEKAPDDPELERVAEHVENAVMLELCEILLFAEREENQ